MATFKNAFEENTPFPQRIPPETEAVMMFADLALLSCATFTSFSEAVDAYLALIMRSLGVRSAYIAQLDARTLKMLQVANKEDGCDIASDSVTALENTFCQYVRALGSPVVVNDAANDPRVMHLVAQSGSKIGAYLGVPLIFTTGIIYGSLCALDPQPRVFRQIHVELAQIVAHHLARLIEYQLLTGTQQALPIPISVNLDSQDDQITLLKMVAHDLRVSLGSIQGYTEMLQGEILGPIIPEQHDALARIRQSIQFINRLTTDLLDAAAANAGTLSLLTYTFDPLDVAQIVLAARHNQAQARGLSLRLNSAETLPQMIGDPDRLQQILLNFLNNALRYTVEGGITLHIAVRGKTIQFSVEDTGPGIPEALHASIWHMHTRHSKEPQGLGLGLYIVKRLAHAMNGSVGVQSTFGHGSTFWVQLPLQGPAPHKAVINP